MNSVASLGLWLKQQRKARDLTQEALAEQVGCSWETIRKIEAGTSRPSRQLAELLAAALDVPAEERLAFVQLARRGVPPAGLEASPRPAAAPASGRLPHPPTPLIGRRAEVAAVCALLGREDVRLVTCTGPGGIGKTRLAIQVAEELQPEFAGGVFFAALATLHDPSLLLATVAQTLDIPEVGSAFLWERLVDRLGDQRILLLLDNFEPLVSAAPQLAELLAATRGLKLLITSQAALHLSGEHRFPVPPLAATAGPQPPGEGTVAAVEEYDAVALFRTRAQAVNPDFAVTPANVAVVTAICLYLDGLPLAIELAAARVKLLPPGALLARLVGQPPAVLPLLTGGARDLPTRQQTLRATLNWSYELLAVHEQALFRCLAVFTDGNTLEAVEHVAGSQGLAAWDETQDSVLDGVSTLIDKSLLQQEESGNEPRVTMLKTVHEYATERLDVSGEADALRRGHAAYYLELVGTTAGRAAQNLTWLAQLAPDRGNLRTAWSWALAHDMLPEIDRALDTVESFYDTQGWYQEGEALFGEAAGILERAGSRSDGETAQLRGRVLARQGLFCARQGRLEAARSLFEASLAVLRPLPAEVDQAYTLHRLGAVVAQLGDVAQAKRYHAESLALARACGDRAGVMSALHILGLDASKGGEYAEAREYYAESLRLARALGDQQMVARTLNYMGYTLCLTGQADEARPLLDESLTLVQSLEDQGLLPYVLGSMGQLAYARGRYREAAEYSLDSLERAQALGDRMLQAYALTRLGDIAAAEGETTEAREYLHQALQTALEIAALPRMLAVLVGCASLRSQAGDLPGATSLLALVLAHPATEHDVRVRAASLLAELATCSPVTIGPPELPSSLEQAVAALLGETASPKKD